MQAIDTQLTPSSIRPFTPNEEVVAASGSPASVFSTFFDAAMGVVNDTNFMQLEADQLQLDLATGRIDDILAVQLAQDRAFTALNFTVQITNRVIESYREIMRMQM